MDSVSGLHSKTSMRDSRYDILFEPVSIGPLTTRNRFYQVPHCTGMGHRYPHAEAQHRGIKAEGGWAVVSTQETEIHPSSDLTPYNEGRLWDERDIPALKLMTDAVHQHGSLAAIQLVHNGLHTSNRFSRAQPLAPSHACVDVDDPVHAREMSLHDIAQFRQWHKDAAIRACRAGFDIIYVYAGHDMTLLQHFLSIRHNHRNDQYGGSFNNRLRLFKEVLADTREAVGHSCAIAVRLAVDELLGSEGIEHNAEGRDIIAALADEPDLWDVNLSDWSNDSQSSRFSAEGYQEPYTAFVKQLTSKPVVGVGRYTSPDTMVRLIKSGHLDLIGAARPSIADPFLPKKIEQGRVNEIRECIGCNICITGDNTCVPMRCTQNPTVGEEWRRDWHPERIRPLKDSASFLIVGGGPAGLEASRALLQRGAVVTLADAALHWGGRVTLESTLPGLSAWARVRDWRMAYLQQSADVQMYLDSRLGADDILEHDVDHVVLATGSRWRYDGVGRTHRRPLPFMNPQTVLTPDDILHAGVERITKSGPVVIYDDDRFYMGGVLAELLANSGFDTVLVTPSATVSPWTNHTLEQVRIQSRLISLGVTIIALHTVQDWRDGQLILNCVYSANRTSIDCHTLISVTSKLPDDALWYAIQARESEWTSAGIQSVTRIGDCLSPALIATACQSGYAYAQGVGGNASQENHRVDHGYRREDVIV